MRLNTNKGATTAVVSKIWLGFNNMEIRDLYVEEELDRDGELSVSISDDETNSVWLDLEEVRKLRDHLNSFLS